MNNLLSVFWDVDGTIAETELCGHRIAFNNSFKDYDIKWFWTKEIYLKLLKISGGLNRIMYYRDKNKYSLSDETCRKIQLRKRFHYNNIMKSGIIKPRNGVLRLMEQLNANDISQYIVTTSGRESLDPLLNTLLEGHSKFITGRVTYEDVDNHKPFPDAYKLALDLCNQRPNSCIAIEDSIIGVKAAKAANINCLLTLPSWHSLKIASTDIANACVDSLGSFEEPACVYYGKPIATKIVDINYLNDIIN